MQEGSGLNTQNLHPHLFDHSGPYRMSCYHTVPITWIKTYDYASLIQVAQGTKTLYRSMPEVYQTYFLHMNNKEGGRGWGLAIVGLLIAGTCLVIFLMFYSTMFS